MTTSIHKTIALNAVILTLILVSAVFSAAGWIIGRQRDARTGDELRVYLETRRAILDRYVEPVDPDAFLFGALNGALESLDRHTVFMPPVESKRFQENVSAHFEGIGVQVRLHNGWFTVFSPWRGSPAHRAGIEAGDRIVGVDGNAIPYPLDDAEFKRLIDEDIRGKPGTTVVLSVSRVDAPARLDIAVRRGDVHIPSVQDARLLSDSPAIAYLRLDGFSGGRARKTENSAAELRDAMKALTQTLGRTPDGVILDLRGNPGGLLSQAVDVANLFLADGVIVSSRGRAGTATESLSAKPDLALWPTLPVAVLIDGGSASASEIVAGCLKDHRRAVIVGETSFGKGSVQTSQEIQLPAKSPSDPTPRTGTIKLTTAKYYTPSGKSIQDIGVAPDIDVRTHRREDEKIQRLKERLFVEYNRQTPRPDAQAKIVGDWLALDAQLATALTVLRDTLPLASADEKQAAIDRLSSAAKRRNAISDGLDAGVAQYVERYRVHLK